MASIVTKGKKDQAIAITHLRDRDNTIVELLYDSQTEKTHFAIWNGEELTEQEQYTSLAGRAYVPLPATNTLIYTKTILLPSTVAALENHKELVESIRAFLHRYVDLSPTFETIATYYVLLSWVHDAFNELPYLRARGAFGSGKTRFLQVIGALCYRGIFASGASTVAPLFHILNQCGGTLLLDEADFRFTDGNAEIVKVLNNGNAKGMPVLRCISKNGKTFEATAYRVFGPKVIASRTSFDDPGLESRFLSENLGRRPLRKDIPLTLPPSFTDEAQELRNLLLGYRFQMLNSMSNEGVALETPLPRVGQIMQPLFSVCDDPKDREVLTQFAVRHAQQLATDLGTTTAAQVLESIATCQKCGRPLSIGNITDAFRTRFGQDYDRKVTPHWIGYVVRQHLHLKTLRVQGVYLIDDAQKEELDGLFVRYGVVDEVESESTRSSKEA